MPSLLSRFEENKRRNALKKIAKSEYKHARGTYHLKMLKDAQKRITAKVKDADREIQRLSVESKQVFDTSQIQLRQVLERHLISTRITEIPGIGNALGSVILHTVYKGNLKDLYRASAYQGIGEAKQYGINAWVRKYQGKLPDLLLENFPGKMEITKQATERITTLETQMKQLHVTRSWDEKNLKGILKWVTYLGNITAEDFINARINHSGNFSSVENYLNGLFPEWEPMPEWFKIVILGAEDVR